MLSEPEGSSEGGADTVVAFCLKYCLDSPIAATAVDRTSSVAVSIWECSRLPARYPEKDAFGG
jgi:hypothetical protein